LSRTLLEILIFNIRLILSKNEIFRKWLYGLWNHVASQIVINIFKDPAATIFTSVLKMETENAPWVMINFKTMIYLFPGQLDALLFSPKNVT